MTSYWRLIYNWFLPLDARVEALEQKVDVMSQNLTDLQAQSGATASALTSTAALCQQAVTAIQGLQAQATDDAALPAITAALKGPTDALVAAAGTLQTLLNPPAPPAPTPPAPPA